MTGRAWTLLALLAFAVVACTALWLRCEGTPPGLEAPSEIGVGRGGSAVRLRASDEDSGVRRFSVVLRHAGGEAVLREEHYPGSPVTGALVRAQVDPVEVRIDPEALGLDEGKASLQVEVSDWSWSNLFSGNVTAAEIPVHVDLTPPRLTVESGLTYVKRGGAAAVVYTVDEIPARDGVQVADRFYAGFPFPGAPLQSGRRFALFAVERDAMENPPIRVVVEDAVGNSSARSWPTRLVDRRFDDVRIDLSSGFMSNKVAELAQALRLDEGSPVADFQHINREVRRQNEARIQEIVGASSQDRLWKGPFVQMRNSAVTSRFAEHRSYFLEGQPVSEAIHYGYDLASTAVAPVEAAGAGQVLFAEELGIYGNCVILDHGLGLASLYGHLSRLDVAAGDRVSRGQVLGLSGSTGLAGGDHLHFAILVGGSYVDPVEWWDPKWVREHVEVRLEGPSP